MKFGKTLILILAILVMPQFAEAQSVSRPSENVKSWRPINNFKAKQSNKLITSNVNAIPPLINVLNGVSFYVNETECNGVKTFLLKVINTNNYPVNVSWQLNKMAIVSVVEIPTKRGLEGSCQVNDDRHSTSLALVKPIGLTEKELKAIKLFFLASISVTETN
jgi:hypothetical protein